MNIKTPKCPICGRDNLIVDDCFSTEFDNGFYYDANAGHCPKCETVFTWEDKYSYSGFINLTQIN